jgi:hypothetical protein
VWLLQTFALRPMVVEMLKGLKLWDIM